ncbi:hypothetical protein JMUB7544_25890 [Staphylococcus aureus]
MDRAANATEAASVRIRNASRNIIQALNLGDLKTANYDQLGKSIEQIKEQLAEAEQDAEVDVADHRRGHEVMGVGAEQHVGEVPDEEERAQRQHQ